PVPVTEAGNSSGNEERLIGRQSCEIANPRAAHTKTEQNERQNAAGRSSEGSDQASGRHQALAALMFLFDRHGRKMRPVVTTGSSGLFHACNHSFASRTHAYRRAFALSGVSSVPATRHPIARAR